MAEWCDTDPIIREFMGADGRRKVIHVIVSVRRGNQQYARLARAGASVTLNGTVVVNVSGLPVEFRARATTSPAGYVGGDDRIYPANATASFPLQVA